MRARSAVGEHEPAGRVLLGAAFETLQDGAQLLEVSRRCVRPRGAASTAASGAGAAAPRASPRARRPCIGGSRRTGAARGAGGGAALDAARRSTGSAPRARVHARLGIEGEQARGRPWCGPGIMSGTVDMRSSVRRLHPSRSHFVVHPEKSETRERDERTLNGGSDELRRASRPRVDGIRRRHRRRWPGRPRRGDPAEAARSPDLSVVVVEKGSEVGAHILSGAVIDPIGLDRLLPDWRERGHARSRPPVRDDRFYWLGPASRSGCRTS